MKTLSRFDGSSRARSYTVARHNASLHPLFPCLLSSRPQIERWRRARGSLTRHIDSPWSSVRPVTCEITGSGGFTLKPWMFDQDAQFAPLPLIGCPRDWNRCLAKVLFAAPAVFGTFMKSLYNNTVRLPTAFETGRGDSGGFGEELVTIDGEHLENLQPRQRLSFTFKVPHSFGCGIHVVGASNETTVEILWFVSYQLNGKWFVTAGRLGDAWEIAGRRTNEEKEKKFQEIFRMRLRFAFPELDAAIGLGLSGVLEELGEYVPLLVIDARLTRKTSCRTICAGEETDLFLFAGLASELISLVPVRLKPRKTKRPHKRRSSRQRRRSA